MSLRKLPLLTTTASLIALSSLSGCASVDSAFSDKSDAGNANYKSAMSVADHARKEGDFGTAATFYKRASQFGPSEVSPLIALADMMWQMKNARQSADVLERAHEIAPDNDVILRNLGRAYVTLGEAEKAQKAYLAALAIDPNSVQTLSGLGISYDLAKDYATAESHYLSGLAINPNDLSLKNNYAFSLISAKRYDDAIPMLESMVQTGKSTLRQRMNLALAYGMVGREDDARKVLAADLDPAQVDRNLKIYRQVRNEPNRSESLSEVGAASFDNENVPADAEQVHLPARKPGNEPAQVQPVMSPEASAVEMQPILADNTVIGTPQQGSKVSMSAEEGRALAAKEASERMAAAPVDAKPVELAPAPVSTPVVAPKAEATKSLSVPSTSSNAGLGGSKIYLGSFADEAEAREAWIRIWTSNSSTLGSLVASIESYNGQMALYAAGSDSAQKAHDICQQLRQSGVSCGVRE